MIPKKELLWGLGAVSVVRIPLSRSPSVFQEASLTVQMSLWVAREANAFQDVYLHSTYMYTPHIQCLCIV